MADSDCNWKPLIKGSKQQVRVDNVLPDLVIVTLKHQNKTYHGALFNSNKENMCYGIRGKRSSLSESCRNRKGDDTLFLKPVAPEEKKEISGLMERHTYMQDKDAVDPKWLSSPKKDISRPLINKSINKMRLRPRQVLCSVCKKGLHSKGTEEKESPKESKVTTKENTSIVQTVKRKNGETTDQPNHKKIKSTHAKSSPAIKISFASPKGVGTVIKIPPRPSTPAPSDSELSQDNSENTECATPQHQVDYKNATKVTKRDKTKKKQVTTGVCEKTQNANTPKKTKHNKHKTKKKLKELSKSKKKQKGKSSSKENISTITQIVKLNLKSSPKTVIAKVTPQCEPVKNDASLRCKVVLEKIDSHSISNSRNSSNASVSTVPEMKCDNTVCENSKITSDAIDNASNAETAGRDPNKEFNYQNYFEDISDSDDSTCLQIDETVGVPGTTEVNNENKERGSLKPLTMKIQNRNVLKTELEDGRIFHEGDVIWGKIVGFPWWPGRITSLFESIVDLGTVIAQNAHISWFGSSTVSVMACSELYPFLQYYKDKFSKKKRGPYKIAIKQAMFMAHSSAEVDTETSNTCSNTPSSQISEVNSLPESDGCLMDVTSTISNENLDLIHTNESANQSMVHVTHMSVSDTLPPLPCDDSQEVPNMNNNIDIIQHASSEHHSEIYDDDVNFEIDESNCVAPSEVFRNIEFNKNTYDDDSELEEGEILSDSNE